MIISLLLLWPPSFHFITTRCPFHSGVYGLDLDDDLSDLWFLHREKNYPLYSQQCGGGRGNLLRPKSGQGQAKVEGSGWAGHKNNGICSRKMKPIWITHNAFNTVTWHCLIRMEHTRLSGIVNYKNQNRPFPSMNDNLSFQTYNNKHVVQLKILVSSWNWVSQDWTVERVSMFGLVNF